MTGCAFALLALLVIWLSVQIPQLQLWWPDGGQISASVFQASFSRPL
jgi:hypothetical protein